MSFTLRPHQERGMTSLGWLQSKHSFSFADYYDPQHMGYSDLRVINDDFVAPAKGFQTHGHRDMEIITYVLSGALEHKDSMGNGSVIPAGDIQYMSAGSGVTHSEFNHSATDPVHFLQIWIKPDAKGYEPAYAQQTLSSEAKHNKLALAISPIRGGGAIEIRQNAKLFASQLNQGVTIDYQFADNRVGWLQLATGKISIGNTTLEAGDGLTISAGSAITVKGIAEQSEWLLFDLRDQAHVTMS